jgi:hypothetical protein
MTNDQAPMTKKGQMTQQAITEATVRQSFDHRRFEFGWSWSLVLGHSLLSILIESE